MRHILGLQNAAIHSGTLLVLKLILSGLSETQSLLCKSCKNLVAAGLILKVKIQRTLWGDNSQSKYVKFHAHCWATNLLTSQYKLSTPVFDLDGPGSNSGEAANQLASIRVRRIQVGKIVTRGIGREL